METITEFNFAKTDDVYKYNVTPNIHLHIKRQNHAVAILYFTDEFDNRIDVPNGITVYESDFQDKNKKSPLKVQSKQMYPLSWTDDYTVVFNKNVLFEIKNQRKWNIIA